MILLFRRKNNATLGIIDSITTIEAFQKHMCDYL